MPRAAVFDLDGTLVDSREDLARAVNHARERLGCAALPREEIVTYVGDGLTKLLERAFHGRADLVEPARPHFTSFYGEHLLDNTPLYPGVDEGIRTLAESGTPMAVLTNKPEGFSRRIIESYGLASCFVDVVGGDTHPTRKPDPAGVRLLLTRMRVAPEEALMVGDHHSDLRTAARAGMRSVFCEYGFGNPDGLIPDHRVASFGEVVRLLAS